MSRIDNKRNVFSKIGSFSSMGEMNKSSNLFNSFSSVNNDADSVSFLFDTIKTTSGSVGVEDAVGGMMGGFIDDSEPKIKDNLKKQLNQPNSGKNLPNEFVNNGVDIPVKDVDSSGKLKTPIDSDAGSLLYGKGDNDFDVSLRNAITNEGDEVVCNNMKIKYNSNTENFTFKPDNGNMSCGDFIDDFIDNTDLLNKDEIVAEVMDDIFGTLSKDMSQEDILKKLELNQLIKQLLDGNESMEISQEVLDNLFNKANNRSKGVIKLDMGCGEMEVSLPISGITKLVNSLSNDDEFSNTNALKILVKDVFDDEISRDNKDTVNDNIIRLIVEGLTIGVIGKAIASPQVRTLMGISSSFDNNNQPEIGEVKDDMKKWKKFIICMKREIIIIIGAFLFAIAIKYLFKLLKRMKGEIIKEKINGFRSSIKSLTRTGRFT